MRSLWSGVSGLRVHQVGMDVEGNNIANVNTYGFKYSRVNYSTMFSQTMAIATQPTGDIGGKNAKQVGLGVEATATQRIHSQGNMQTTDSNYDVAISGNGFFLVSNDGGRTQYLTRDGAFNQDAAGNFVNSSGYVVQGWLHDPITGRIDTTLPASNLSWDPSMSLPANPSSRIYLNASLNSGRKITQDTSRYVYSLDSVHNYRESRGINTNENGDKANEFYTTTSNAIDVTEKAIDFAAIYNSDTYESLNLRSGQSFWFSYKSATFTTDNRGLNAYDDTNPGVQNGVIFWGNSVQSTVLDIEINGQKIYSDSIQNQQQAVALIQSFKSVTGVDAVASGNGISLTNTNRNGTGDNMKNIKLVVGSKNTAGESWNVAANAGTRVPANFTYPQGGKDVANTNTIDTTWIAGNGQGGANAANNMAKTIITAHRYEYNSAPQTVPHMIDPTKDTYDNALADAAVTAINAGNTPTEEQLKHYNYALAVGAGSLLKDEGARVFHSTEDLRELMQRDARYGVDYNSRGNDLNEWNTDNVNRRVTLTINSTGRYTFANPNETSDIPQITLNAAGNNPAINVGANITSNAKNMEFQATSYASEDSQTSANDALTTIFKGLQGSFSTGNQTKQSASMVLSSYSSALQVYDSLGTQHLIRVEWTKHETTVDGGNLWQMILRIDEPANFNAVGLARNNIIVGEVRFGNDGSLVSYEPTTITFSGNNGSAPNQLIDLNLGAVGGFNGLVSNDQKSGIAQQDTDGYKPGMMLQGMQNKQIDQEGNIIASFDNGIQKKIGKIAMGNVTNEAGLEEVGSNLFRASANSGTLTVGSSNTGGRGTFKSATLEMSNADLSLSLTNLIVIQRGYQANSKTITTSDTMLNTLLQLKQ